MAQAAREHTTVISLDQARKRHKRASLRKAVGKVRPAQLIVSLWFGAALFAAAALIGALMMVAVRQGWIGLTIGVAIGAAIAWRTAGRWLQRSGTPADPPQLRRARS